ncbi:MAG: BMP family ABC transporter substrate-binding protein, partial [Candidatus Izemoplasmatales bacterium]|nr:BMP family ABC transporter substrate-binding protein [Candidatus Izemoplasmatales bacterium]
ETAIFEVQADYPDVAFLILDGEPNNGDFSNDGPNLVYETADNVHCVLYQEEQAGFLAGYAAVQEGFRSLGFIGGMAVPAVIRYGYGYVQGAEKAAVDLGLATGAVTMKYYYVGTFEGSDALETKMDGWYAAGVEVIFSCGGKLYTSVVAAAANTTAGKVIGVDVDQQAESDRIITSAMKALTLSVEESLEAFFDNEKAWPATLAGKTRTMGAVENGIGLPTAAASWRLTNFTVTEYNALFADLVDGDIVVSASTAAEPTVTKIVVDYDA